MGQTPAKYFLPSAPYGASEAANALNPVQPGATNPQTPLLPPTFQDPGTMQTQAQSQSGAGNPFVAPGANNPFGQGQQNPFTQMFGRGLF